MHTCVCSLQRDHSGCECFCSYLLQEKAPRFRGHFAHLLHSLNWFWESVQLSQGASTLLAKHLANASTFDKASFPNRADTDEMALQAKGTLEEVDCGTPPVRRGGVCGKHQELKTVRTDAFARRSRIRW